MVKIKYKFMQIKLKFLLAEHNLETYRKISVFRDCIIILDYKALSTLKTKKIPLTFYFWFMWY